MKAGTESVMMVVDVTKVVDVVGGTVITALVVTVPSSFVVTLNNGILVLLAGAT